MAVILQALIIAFPVFIYDSDAESSFIARQILVVMVPSSILFLVFVPKVSFWIQHREFLKQQREERRQRHGIGEINDDENDDGDFLANSLVSATAPGLKVISFGASKESFRRGSDLGSGIKARNPDSSLVGPSIIEDGEELNPLRNIGVIERSESFDSRRRVSFTLDQIEMLSEKGAPSVSSGIRPDDSDCLERDPTTERVTVERVGDDEGDREGLGQET